MRSRSVLEGLKYTEHTRTIPPVSTPEWESLPATESIPTSESTPELIPNMESELNRTDSKLPPLLGTNLVKGVSVWVIKKVHN